MMQTALDIMTTSFPQISALKGIRQLKGVIDENGLDCFPVVEDGTIIGALTLHDVLKAHPNRLAVDAMSGKMVRISVTEYLWKIRKMAEEEEVDLFLVDKSETVVGIITRQMLRSELEKHVDPLTKLYRSEALHYKILELFEKVGEVSVLFLDVNDFGLINKKYGHTVGDAILRELAALFSETLPDRAFLCRYGGDEFTLVVPIHLEGCAKLADRLLRQVRDHRFPQGIAVSVSAGISGGNRGLPRGADPFETVSNLLNLASLASTRAKTEPGHVWIHSEEISAFQPLVTTAEKK